MSQTRPSSRSTNLVRRYGRTDAVNGLSLRVAAGPLLRLLRPQRRRQDDDDQVPAESAAADERRVDVFGLDPAQHEVAVKSRLAYVPDHVAFYPWMTVRETLDYFASFRAHWNRDTEAALLQQFRLDLRQKASHLSKGQRTQLALITAICPEPELLVLDEPTSGLDPIVRREFIQTVIGAYQDGEPERRTVFVSTHLISEFEGLIDEFTIIDGGRDVLTLEADAARERYQKIYARFASEPGPLDLAGARVLRQRGREVEIVVNGNAARRHGAPARARARSR